MPSVMVAPQQCAHALRFSRGALEYEPCLPRSHAAARKYAQLQTHFCVASRTQYSIRRCARTARLCGLLSVRPSPMQTRLAQHKIMSTPSADTRRCSFAHHGTAASRVAVRPSVSPRYNYIIVVAADMRGDKMRETRVCRGTQAESAFGQMHLRESGVCSGQIAMDTV